MVWSFDFDGKQGYFFWSLKKSSEPEPSPQTNLDLESKLLLDPIEIEQVQGPSSKSSLKAKFQTLAEITQAFVSKPSPRFTLFPAHVNTWLGGTAIIKKEGINIQTLEEE